MEMLKTFTSQPVKYVINTHYHGDHSGGNAKLQALKARSSRRRRRASAWSRASSRACRTSRSSATRSICLGGKRVRSTASAAPTPTATSSCCSRRSACSRPATCSRSAMARRSSIDYAGGGSAKEWTAHARQALKLDFDTVVPGHGVVTTKPEMKKFRDSTLALRTCTT